MENKTKIVLTVGIVFLVTIAIATFLVLKVRNDNKKLQPSVPPTTVAEETKVFEDKKVEAQLKELHDSGQLDQQSLSWEQVEEQLKEIKASQPDNIKPMTQEEMDSQLRQLKEAGSVSK